MHESVKLFFPKYFFLELLPANLNLNFIFKCIFYLFGLDQVIKAEFSDTRKSASQLFFQNKCDKLTLGNIHILTFQYSNCHQPEYHEQARDIPNLPTTPSESKIHRSRRPYSRQLISCYRLPCDARNLCQLFDLNVSGETHGCIK